MSVRLLSIASTLVVSSVGKLVEIGSDSSFFIWLEISLVAAHTCFVAFSLDDSPQAAKPRGTSINAATETDILSNLDIEGQ
jgi:hypothetical protein